MLEPFGWDERWTGGLGADWRVTEEGLPTRTTVLDGHHKNGLTYLRPCLESQLPVDVLLLMLAS